MRAGNAWKFTLTFFAAEQTSGVKPMLNCFTLYKAVPLLPRVALRCLYERPRKRRRATALPGKLGRQWLAVICGKLPSELGEYAKHIEEGLSGGGARIDRLLSRAQSHASLPQLMNDVLKIPQ
jgi:hypothetical protein